MENVAETALETRFYWIVARRAENRIHKQLDRNLIVKHYPSPEI